MPFQIWCVYETQCRSLTDNARYLFNAPSNSAAFINAGCIVWEVEYWRVVVTVTNTHTERTEPRQPRSPKVLGLDRDAMFCDANLCFSVKDVCSADNSSVSFHLKAFNIV